MIVERHGVHLALLSFIMIFNVGAIAILIRVLVYVVWEVMIILCTG